MFDKWPEAFGVIAGFGLFGIRPKADFGKRTAIGVMINHIGLLHISFCKRRAGFVSFAEFSCFFLGTEYTNTSHTHTHGINYNHTSRNGTIVGHSS